MSSWFDKLAAKPQRSIIFLGLVLLLAGNWILPLTDRDETRFAEASREMLERGDLVVPWFNGAWRFDKPILIYWCQAASYTFLGVNDFAARLPSALFTTATALLLVRWGRTRMDIRTGFLAGAIFLTALHVAIIGRVATADMALVFFFTLAAWSGWELTRPQNDARKSWWGIFYVALGLGFLAKGPVAWLPLGGIILARVLRKNSFRLPIGETLLGLVLTVAIAAAWGIPAMQQTHGEFFRVGLGEHVLHRSTGVIDGHGFSGWKGYIFSAPVYFITFIVSFLPWTIRRPEGFDSWLQIQKQKGGVFHFLAFVAWLLLYLFYIPIKIWRWWPQRKGDDLGWFLLLQALLVFAAFSLVRTKLPHYTMPAFPLLALWFARQVSSGQKNFLWIGHRVFAMSVFILVLMLGAATVLRPFLLTENLWRSLAPHVRPETKIGAFGYVEPGLVWKCRAVSTNYLTLGRVTDAKDFLTNAPPLILILPTEQMTNLPDTNGLQFSASGLELVKFQNRTLTVIVR
jgi:4-amino-4-deoxy-L-arabinose transferase-like glycosyltransferase